MTVNERDRVKLYARLEETLGHEHAEVLMEYLPPVGWNDVARRHDVEGVRAELHVLRAEMHTGFAELRAELRVELHQQLNRHLVWTIGAIFTSVGAILGMIAYVN